ncbi:MAG: zinc-binding protein [Ignavibacteriae bacterium]|nr:zinc-binding protein [Ignavibacteriota bacterium]|tara:strand:+ start:139 stop:531 length:393 start_codon:yes stop_codon:yes gene_type:complete
MESKNKNELPIIYSCSGTSNVAQLANDIAVKINEEEIAEMSCIAGVGGKVKPLVKKAQSGRPIIVIDGCPLNCAKACLNNVDVEPDKHIVLTDYNLKKKFNSKLRLEDEEELYNKIVEETKMIYPLTEEV